MRKNIVFAVLFSVPAALAASGLESDRTQQLPPVDAGSLLNQINSQNDNFINPMPQAIISQEMQFALEAASELRKDLKNYGVKGKVGLVNEPKGGYGLWVEFRNWSDYEKIKDLFYQDPGNNPSYMDLKVYPRVPKKSIDYRPEEVTVHFFDEWGAGEKQIPAALKKHGIAVVSVENEGNVTTIIYKSANWMIKTSDTKGEYGPSDNKEIDAEIRQITRNLQKEGKTVVWSGRWDDMVNGGTVYYLEPKMHIMDSKAGQSWRQVQLKASDGTSVSLNYSPLDLGGTVIAEPLWITVSNPAFRGGEKAQAEVITYYEATSSSGEMVKDTVTVDLQYNGQGFQAKGPSVYIREGHHAWTHTFRQEIAVSVDGEWLTDPVNGTHNFRVKLDGGQQKGLPEFTEAEKKIKVCWLKSYEKNLCSYKCRDGSLYSQPIQIPLPWDNTPVIPCPQVIFPF